jgi:hypothetical protein
MPASMPLQNRLTLRATCAFSRPRARPVPRISSFYGIVIAMYYREHGVPHFHAVYGGFKASISISSTESLGGSLPPQAFRLVKQRAFLHREELLKNWDLAQQGKVLESVDPLP